MNKKPTIRPLLLAGLLALLAGCGQPKPAADTQTQAAASAPAETPPAPAPATPVALPRTPAPAGASVSIVSPKDGDKVKSPVKVVFVIEGMALVPAGDATPASGHHHLLIDTPLPADLGQPIPKDDQHQHFGKAQTEAEVTLAPGPHTLQLLLGDANHVPHEPPVASTVVNVTVE